MSATIGDLVHCFGDGGGHIFGTVVHLFALGDLLYTVIMTEALIAVVRADDEFGMVLDGRPAAFGYWAPDDGDKYDHDLRFSAS